MNEMLDILYFDRINLNMLMWPFSSSTVGGICITKEKKIHEVMPKLPFLANLPCALAKKTFK